MLVLLVTGVVAVNAQVYVEVDLTSQFNSLATTQWWGSSGQVGWAAPAVDTNSGLHVAAWERYDGNCTSTGTLMKSTVTGLTTGTYKIELYGASAFTFGRGFGSDAFTGGSSDTSTSFNENDQITENTGVTLYAKTSEGTYGGEIPISYATNFNSTGIATVVIEGVEVGANGEIEIGMTKTSTSTNWHVIQLKGVTALVEAVPVYNQALSDAQAALTQKMSASAQNNLSTAISNYGGLGETGTAAQYTAAIEALTNATSAAQNSINAYAIFNSVIDVFADAKQALDADGLAAYDDGGVLAGLQESYNAGTLQEITSEQKAAMANALAVASKAQTSDNSPMTWAIVNHSFETGSLEAWTAENTAGDTGVKPNSNNTYQTTGCDGDFLFNTWHGDAVGYGISQTIADMPAGSYKLTASIAGLANATVELFANNESTSFTQTAPGTFTDVDLEFDLASAGDITIGTQNSTSWYKVDNFRLILLQPAVVQDYTISLNVTGTNDIGDAPTITVTGATQSGDVAYTAAANSTISITPEAVDGYSVEVTVTQTPATGGPEETVSASEVSGTWSFTLPENNVRVSIAYTPIPTYAVTLITTGTEEMETMPTVSLTGGTIVENVFTATAGSTITVSAQAVQGYSVDVTVTETAPAGDPQTITPTLSNGKWSFTQPDYNTTVTVAYTHRINTITWVLVGLDESVEKPAVTFSGNGLVPVMEGETITSYQGPQGSTVTFTAPEIEGYEIDRVYNGGYEQTLYANEGVYSFGIGRTSQEYFDSSDHNIQIVYTKINYTITGLPVDNTTLTIGENEFGMGDVTATVGTIITVTPDLGYQITAITATYTPATGGDPIELTIDDAAGNGKSFTMPAANVTVTCTAEEIVIDPNAIPVTVPALSFVTYVDDNQDLSLATGDQAQLFGVSDVTDTEVLLTDQLTSVPSGQHFLIYNPTDADIIAQLMPSAPTGGFEGVGNWFYLDINDGTINPDDYTGFTLYICGGKQFLKAIGAGQLADHRWMLAVDNEPSDGGMKSRNIVFGETTNKITATNIKNATKGDFFDLQGRKVKAPKKGLYIVNGKKAVIK